MMVANSCLKMTDIFFPLQTQSTVLQSEVILKTECLLNALTCLSFTYHTKEKKQVGRKSAKEVVEGGRRQK